MLKEFRYRIKADGKVKKLPRPERVIPVLKVNDQYFISYGGNWAYPCHISAIVNEFEKTEVRVKIRVTEKISYYRSGGKLIYDPYEERLVYADEIGTTPEDAVRNCV